MEFLLKQNMIVKAALRSWQYLSKVGMIYQSKLIIDNIVKIIIITEPKFESDFNWSYTCV